MPWVSMHSYIEARVKRIILEVVPWGSAYGETEYWGQEQSSSFIYSETMSETLTFLTLNFLICRIRFHFLSIK